MLKLQADQPRVLSLKDRRNHNIGAISPYSTMTPVWHMVINPLTVGKALGNAAPGQSTGIALLNLVTMLFGSNQARAAA